MVNFIRYLLRLAFAGTAVFLFFTACASHKKCGDENGKKKKYHSKRYRAAIHERDSLCNLVKIKQEELAGLNSKYEDVDAKFQAYKKASGAEREKLNSDVGKLNEDLGSKQALLSQREERLRQLESILAKQDELLNRLHNSVKNALLGFSSDELTVEQKNGKVYVSMSDKLLFKSGDANVETKGKEALKKLAEVLNKNQDVSIAIEGHTDNIPIKTAIYKDNWDLSAARATNVVRLLSNEYGMDARKLTASGKGEFFPIGDNASPEGRAKNRRTEIVLSPKLEELMKLIENKG